MQSVCDTCGKDLAKVEVACSVCKVPYCSKECLDQEDRKKCKAPDVKDVHMILNFLGTKMEQVPVYNMRKMLTFPGPISGKVPKALRPVSEGEGAKVIQAWRKQYGTPPGGAVCYYIVDLFDAARVFFGQLTEEQRTEMFSIMVQQTGQVMMKKGQSSSKTGKSTEILHNTKPLL